MQPIEDVFYCNPKNNHPLHAESQSTSPPRFLQHFNPITTCFLQAQQPAHVPVNYSTPLADAEELVRFSTPRPLAPRPDKPLYRHMRSTSLGTRATWTGATIPGASPNARQARRLSPASIGDHLVDTWAMPSAIGRDSRWKTVWLKTRAQYTSDRELQRYSVPERPEVLHKVDQQPRRADCSDVGPKRKQSAFVKEEELKCLFEDRAGTPHISEL